MTLDILQLHQDDWRPSITGGNFDRGVRYAAEGRSQLLSLHQQTLMASCRGTSGQVYRQRIQLQAQEFGWRIDGHCGCPVRYNCKHVVAALLTASTRRAVPGTSTSANEAAASCDAVTVHHTAWVRRCRGGRLSGSSPSTVPVR